MTAIKTHYNLGSVVITKSDGAFEKGKVKAIRLYLRDDALEPIINYEIIIKWRDVVRIDKQRKSVYSTVEYFTINQEAELKANFNLYKKTETTLSEEQRKLPQAERDRLILWNMRFDKSKIPKEEDKDVGTKTTN